MQQNAVKSIEVALQIYITTYNTSQDIYRDPND
jgi:hypothetical protein